MIHGDIITCFDEAASYLSNVTHKSMSCINPVGKTVMEVQIQNLSFESYVLATRNPERV